MNKFSKANSLSLSSGAKAKAEPPCHCPCGRQGLYRLVLEAITRNPISLTDEEDVCMAAWVVGPRLRGRNMAKEVLRYTTAKQDLWRRKLGHPRVTVLGCYL